MDERESSGFQIGTRNMDRIKAWFAKQSWVYGDKDPKARTLLANRIRSAGATKDQFLTYTDLVSSVPFCLPNVGDGRPFYIDEWTNLNRSIIGSFLGRISADSYLAGEFLAGALVYGAIKNQPSESFWTLARDAGLTAGMNEDKKLEFWFKQVGLARTWYQSTQGE